ncbi:MAG: hypothetical protein ACTHK8_13150 [Ginsengibacter sp.]
MILFNENDTTAYIGFCASGADGINISICPAIISSSGRPNTISKRINNQLFYSTFGCRFGQTGILISHLRKALDVVYAAVNSFKK